MQLEPRTVDPSVLRELRPGEQLLWWGRPDPQHQVRQDHAYTYILLACIIAALAYLLYFCVETYFGTRNGLLLAPIFLVICMLLLLVLVLYAYLRLYRKLASDLRHTTYAVTNQRIIVMVANPQGLNVTSHTAEDMGAIQLIETGDGWGDVSYGLPHTFAVGAARITIIDKLAGIPNARMVENLLNRTFKQMPSPGQQAWAHPQPYPYASTPQQYEPFQHQE